MKKRIPLRELIIFSLLSALMVIGQILFESIPNVHPIAALIVVYTLVYRAKALIPIYVYVLIQGIRFGFNMWWAPYLYVWLVLWGITMLLPRKMPTAVEAFVYPAVNALHGLLFGTLSAPLFALLSGLNFDGMIKWIIAGLPFDALHAVGNLVAGLLILPISKVLRKLENK